MNTTFISILFTFGLAWVSGFTSGMWFMLRERRKEVESEIQRRKDELGITSRPKRGKVMINGRN